MFKRMNKKKHAYILDYQEKITYNKTCKYFGKKIRKAFKEEKDLNFQRRF